jgi:hypothetical protein
VAHFSEDFRSQEMIPLPGKYRLTGKPFAVEAQGANAI